MGQVLPDGLGGILATWYRRESVPLGQPVPTEWTVSRFDAEGARVDHPVAPETSIRMVGDAGTAYVTGEAGGEVSAVDVTSWTPKWVQPVTGEPLMAIAGGGLAVRDYWTEMLSVISETGVVRSTTPMPARDAYQSLRRGARYGVSMGRCGSAS
jgi:outer membrane protein assembly factor BamB